MSNVATLRAGGHISGIAPQSFEDVQRLAMMALKSGLFKGDKKDDNESKLAKASMCIMMGMDVGIPPMQALQGMAVINGKIVIYGDLLTAILWANGCKIKQDIKGDGDARVATATVVRPDGTRITRTFSVIEAKKARLWDDRTTVKKQWDGKWEEKPNDAAWFRFSDRMMGWRALGFAIKDGASDFTRGIEIREDIENDRMVDITPKADSIPGIPSIPQIPDIASEPTIDQSPMTPTGYLAELEDALSVAKGNDEALGDVWAEHLTQLPDLDAATAQEAAKLYRAATQQAAE